MKYQLSIGGLGDIYMTVASNRKEEIVAFLKQHDHEGAMLTLIVNAEDDDVYAALDIKPN